MLLDSADDKSVCGGIDGLIGTWVFLLVGLYDRACYDLKSEVEIYEAERKNDGLGFSAGTVIKRGGHGVG